MSDDKPEQGVELSTDQQKRTQALVLYLHGYGPVEIGARLRVTPERIRRWAKGDRWDQMRDSAKRDVQRKVLRGIKKQYADLINDQFRQIKYLESRIFRNLDGKDSQGQVSTMVVRTPNGEEVKVPIGELSFDSAYEAVSMLVQLGKLRKDLLFQLMPSISEALPLVEPGDLNLAIKKKPELTEEEDKPRNQSRAERRAKGKQNKLSEAAKRVLEATDNILPFEREEKGMKNES